MTRTLLWRAHGVVRIFLNNLKSNRSYPMCFICLSFTLALLGGQWGRADSPFTQVLLVWIHLHICLLVFVFFCVVLEPYKYAGYPMLIKTIQLETRDDRLFSKAAHLLTAACELAFHTVNCSALNAEELCREQGIEVSICQVCSIMIFTLKENTEPFILISIIFAICFFFLLVFSIFSVKMLQMY